MAEDKVAVRCPPRTLVAERVVRQGFETNLIHGTRSGLERHGIDVGLRHILGGQNRAVLLHDQLRPLLGSACGQVIRFPPCRFGRLGEQLMQQPLDLSRFGLRQFGPIKFHGGLTQRVPRRQFFGPLCPQRCRSFPNRITQPLQFLDRRSVFLRSFNRTRCPARRHEHPGERVIIFLRDGVEFVIVASSTGDGHREKRL